MNSCHRCGCAYHECECESRSLDLQIREAKEQLSDQYGYRVDWCTKHGAEIIFTFLQNKYAKRG